MIERNVINELLSDFVASFSGADIPADIPTAIDVGADMAAKTFALTQYAISLARERAVCTDFDFKAELAEELVGTSEEFISGELHEAVYRRVLDEDGDVVFSGIMVRGQSTGKDGDDILSRLDTEVLGLATKRATERGVKPNVPPEVWADVEELIERNLAGAPDQIVDQNGNDLNQIFNPHIQRAADRTEAEIAEYRSEIDSLFETWEGGGGT